GHAHLDQALAVVAMGDVGLVDQAKVDDVYRDLGIEAGAHLRPHQPLDRGIVGALLQLQRLRRLLADGVGVVAGDAEQVALHEHREAAAQRLGDVADAARRQGDFVALRHEHRVAVALEADGFTVAGIHVRLTSYCAGLPFYSRPGTLSCTTPDGAAFHAPNPIPARSRAGTCAGAGRK